MPTKSNYPKSPLFITAVQKAVLASYFLVKPIMFLKIIIFVFTLYLFLSQITLASTSCAGKQTVLGFSQDWKQMYWDQQIAGECSPGNIMHVFDFEKQQDKVVSSLFDDSKPSDKKKYHALRQRIKSTLSLPPKRKNRNVMNGRCSFTSSLKLSRDDYLEEGIKTIHSVYFNPTFQSWVVVSEECNSGDSEILGVAVNTMLSIYCPRNHAQEPPRNKRYLLP